MDDILPKATAATLGAQPELSSDEVVRAYRAITAPQVMTKRAVP
jgi:hypothetical protein